MKYVLDDLRLWRAQTAFVATAVISVPTRRQFTSELHGVMADHPTSSLLALWRLWRRARQKVRHLQSLPGEHDLSGSDFRPGLFGTREGGRG